MIILEALGENSFLGLCRSQEAAHMPRLMALARGHIVATSASIPLLSLILLLLFPLRRTLSFHGTYLNNPGEMSPSPIP